MSKTGFSVKIEKMLKNIEKIAKNPWFPPEKVYPLFRPLEGGGAYMIITRTA